MMTLSQTFLNKGDYLLVSVEGSRSKEGLQAAIRGLAEYCQQHGIERVVVDTRHVQGDLSLMNWFNVGQSSDLFNVGVRRLAVVRAPDINDMDFAETVAVNRGFTVKLFVDLDEAEQWIIE